MLDLTAKDTIVAPVTPSGAGGVAIVRLSGSSSREMVAALLDPDAIHRWAAQDPRVLQLFTLLTPVERAGLDQVLLVWFEEGRSFTGEESVEIQCHGSPLVVEQILQACLRLGSRLAEPGEFSFRAFRNGRLDLTAAEGLLALTQSRTRAGHLAALRTLEGGLRKPLEELRARLVGLMAELEVTFDYPEDVQAGYNHESIANTLSQLQVDLQPLLADYERQQIWAEGLRVVFVGAPNAGKSSLFNALLGEDRALVHATPGTTRDVIEATLLQHGHRIRLFDTAGHREDAEGVESAGLAMAEQYLEDAHLLLHVVDGSSPPTDADVAISGAHSARLVVLNKSDLPVDPAQSGWAMNQQCRVLPTSVSTGAGIPELRLELVELAAQSSGNSMEALYLTQRQYGLLQTVATELAAGYDLALALQPEDLIVMHLREALSALLSITGEVYDTAVLDAIFSQFCVGK